MRSKLIIAALAAALTLPAHAPSTKTPKMQSTWPASLTLQDNFRFFAERVDKLTSSQLKIDAMPAGQVVPASEWPAPTQKKGFEGPHAVFFYWVARTRPPRFSPPRRRAPSAWTR